MEESLSNRKLYEYVFYTKRLGLTFKFQNSKAFVTSYDEGNFESPKPVGKKEDDLAEPTGIYSPYAHKDCTTINSPSMPNDNYNQFLRM